MRDNEAVPLTPKALQVLLVLVRRNKELVTKEELLQAVWPDTFVEENNLSRNVFLLRKAMGGSAQDHQYIITVPGRGYRFAEDVRFARTEEADLVAPGDLTEKGQSRRSWPWGWITAGLFLLSVVAVFSFRQLSRRSFVLTEKDTVVLADFGNSTGDAVFDGTLRQGLAIQLEQSPYLRIMDDAQVQREQRLMNLPPDSRISNQVARDVCVRAGAAATIEGAISSLGKSYVLNLRAITCRDGSTLAREQIQAADKDHVLNALSSATSSLRRKLGESRKSLEQLNQPLEQATTASLNALQNYSAGLAVMNRGHFLSAVPMLDRALAIDPNFAMASYYLAIAYEQAGDLERCVLYANQAFRRVDHVSEPERIEITAYYYRSTGELEKEIDAYQQAIRTYPGRWGFHLQLSLTYIDLGQFEEGLREAEESIRLQPDVEPPYRRLLDAYLCLDRFSQAHKVADEVRKRGLDGPRIHQRYLELAFAEKDDQGIAREIRWFSGKREEYLSLGLQAANLNVQGRRSESHKQYLHAAEAALHQGFRYVSDEFLEADARADALSGRCETAHSLGRPGVALAMCGETARAEKLVAETSKTSPNATLWNAVSRPEVEALNAIFRNQPDRGVELMASATPYERAYPDAVYVRGLAYLRMQRGREAAAEFQKIADHKGASWGATWIHPNWGQYYALSYLGMARGYAMTGNTVRAKEAFHNLLALWKNADPELPVLKQALAESNKLNGLPALDH
ncbi:transcriptional regulator [Terriglobus roseus]|uniref:transcriptional regulator n=1 Tax=Terriglobus roseus TaxID=392734 RepID=UPI00244EAB95|nr:transcriptional regulator [Terriglobus roseus]